VVELRAADLRFTESEAAQFLNQVMGLHLDASSVAALAERTEGWVAGLQMAAISLRERQDVSRFIEGFSGTNRYILDYLLEEVLANQPPDIQAFLLCTSILERLSAPLCEIVLEFGRQKNQVISAIFSRDSLLDCQAIIERLERGNLFLEPLDDERQWYRYHHLFADLLRHRLDQAYPGLAPRLHWRASEWYEYNGSILEAIHHASLAADNERVERLIEANYIEMANRGEMAWIRHWIGKLPKELVYRRPWLCLYEAMNRCWFGHLDEATFLLDKAESGFRSEASDPAARSMRAYHDYVKSRVCAMQGDMPQAIELCQAARENTPPENLGLQIDFTITLGYEYFLYGDFENATRFLNEMIQSGQAAGAINNPVAGYAVLARLQSYQGRLHQADDLLQKAARLIQEGEGQHLGVTGLVEVGKAALKYEWNDLAAALILVKQGLGLLPQWGKADDMCLAYTTLARILFAQGNQAGAAEAVEKAANLVHSGGVFCEARSAVEAAQVRTWLAQGDWLAVDRWLSALDRRFVSPGEYRFEDELAHITQARVWMAQRRHVDALRLLSRLEETARLAGRAGKLLEILVLQALAFQAAGDPRQAHTALAKGLALGEPEGFRRIFLDEGQPMQTLLKNGLAVANLGPLRDYAAHLLAQFDSGPLAVEQVHKKASHPGELVEPLSPRELEVLELLSMGHTNQEIARQLVVSPGTVKAHTASIYRKLDVANRTEAASRARELRIL
jgi:LuxR family maltose regulon positive regulatory protein